MSRIGEQIADEFKQRLNGVKLTPDEAALVERVSNRLAGIAVLEPGSSPAEMKWLEIRRDLALATLANLSIAKAINTEDLLRASAFAVLTRLIAAGVKVGIAVVSV